MGRLNTLLACCVGTLMTQARYIAMKARGVGSTTGLFYLIPKHTPALSTLLALGLHASPSWAIQLCIARPRWGYPQIRANTCTCV